LDFSVYNITKNEKYKYVNEYVINRDFKGDHNDEFLWITEFIYNDRNNFIAINGRDITKKALVTVCDFNKPEMLPYKFMNLSEIIYKKYCDEDSSDSFSAAEWLPDNSLKIKIGRRENKKEIIIKENDILGGSKNE
jgi:hypothetical protein